jgi:hypothetical protein
MKSLLFLSLVLVGAVSAAPFIPSAHHVASYKLQMSMHHEQFNQHVNRVNAFVQDFHSKIAAHSRPAFRPMPQGTTLSGASADCQTAFDAYQTALTTCQNDAVLSDAGPSNMTDSNFFNRICTSSCYTGLVSASTTLSTKCSADDSSAASLDALSSDYFSGSIRYLKALCVKKKDRYCMQEAISSANTNAGIDPKKADPKKNDKAKKSGGLDISALDNPSDESLGKMCTDECLPVVSAALDDVGSYTNDALGFSAAIDLVCLNTRKGGKRQYCFASFKKFSEKMSGKDKDYSFICDPCVAKVFTWMSTHFGSDFADVDINKIRKSMCKRGPDGQLCIQQLQTVVDGITTNSGPFGELTKKCEAAAKSSSSAKSEEEMRSAICNGDCGGALGSFLKTYGCCFQHLGDIISASVAAPGSRRLLESSTSKENSNPLSAFTQVCPNLKLPDCLAAGKNVTMTLTLKNLRYSAYSSSSKKSTNDLALVSDIAYQAGASPSDVSVVSSSAVDATTGQKVSAFWHWWAGSQSGTQVKVVLTSNSGDEGTTAGETIQGALADNAMSFKSTSALSASTKNDVATGQTADASTSSVTVSSAGSSSSDANTVRSSVSTVFLVALGVLFARIL